MASKEPRMSASSTQFTFSSRSRPRARPAHDAARAPAGTRTRSRGSPPRRWRSAPRPPPAGQACPPARRSRAAAAARPPSVCTPFATASPGSSPMKPRVQIREGSPPGPARSPPTSPRPPRARPWLSAEYAARRRSTSTWCRSAVNRALLSLCATRRTRSSALGTLCSGSASGACFAGRVPLGQPLPSTASAPARAALFGGFVGTTGRPTSHARSSRLMASAFPARPAPPSHRRATVGSPGSRARRAPRMRGVSRPRGVRRRLAIAPPSCCLPPPGTASAPRWT